MEQSLNCFDKIEFYKGPIIKLLNQQKSLRVKGQDDGHGLYAGQWKDGLKEGCGIKYWPDGGLLACFWE